MENSNIAWTHHTQNFWLGCDKVAPECAHCYIDRTLRKMGRDSWGKLYRAVSTWKNPDKWEAEAASKGCCYRVFTNSLSDFFHAEADDWREEAWDIIRRTPHLVYLILTKRPELIGKRLPTDWNGGWSNVWLGVSTGCKMTLNKMDSLRKIPVHPQAVRFVSCEPLLEDIADQLNLDGFGWVIAGGESGTNPEYLWNEKGDWRKEFERTGRRTMEVDWARSLLKKARTAGVPYFFKQVTAGKPEQGADALGSIIHEVPSAPVGLTWAEKEGESALSESVNARRTT
jgi:protein gp37